MSAPARTGVRQTVAEWKAKGTALFGPDVMKWRFVCPSCGHVQTPADFKPFADKGATPNSALITCIGRFDGHMDVDMCSGKSPCNYAGFGLFNLCPQIVVDPDGEETICFAFDED